MGADVWMRPKFSHSMSEKRAQKRWPKLEDRRIGK
ncbi:UNVERIFIED_ORG: hypothetical protein M2348_001648 [Sphingomonas sp. R1F5B]